MPSECAEPFGRPRDRCERRKRNVLPSAGDNRKRYRDDVVTREHESHRLSPLLRTVRRTRPRLGEGLKRRALLMSIRAIRVNGRKVWHARVAFKGLRKSTIRASKDEARHAESDLPRELRDKAGESEQAAAAPATLRKLLEFYAEDMQSRGKGEESVERVEYTVRRPATAGESRCPPGDPQR